MRSKAWTVWPTLIAIGIIAEFRSLRRHDGGTFSEFVRTVFCVRHLTGKVLFVAAWLLLTRLFLPHILRVVDDALVELEDASETI